MVSTISKIENENIGEYKPQFSPLMDPGQLVNVGKYAIPV